MDSSILDSDTDDDLPPGWEERCTMDGRVFYASHVEKKTQWQHPTTGREKTIAGELPYGWERRVSDEGYVIFVDHINKRTTYTDPRLAFARDRASKLLAIKYDANTKAHQVLLDRDLSKKYYIVTGANSGIGVEITRALANVGGHVTLACRDVDAARGVCDQLRSARADVKVECMHVDLSSLESVRRFAEAYIQRGWPCHGLILNAGVYGLPWQKTEDGFEITCQVNYLSQLYLALLLKPVLCNSAPSRVVFVSSESHRMASLDAERLMEQDISLEPQGFVGFRAYNVSKLCQVLAAAALNKRLERSRVNVFSCHPGNLVSTGISRYWWLYRLVFYLVKPFTKTPEQAAATPVYCVVNRGLDRLGGHYFNNCNLCPSRPNIEQAIRTGEALVTLSCQLLQRSTQTDLQQFISSSELS